MTSVSATPAHHMRTSPRDMLQKELESEVSSGAIASSDESALSKALDDIDTTLKSAAEASTSTSTSSTTPEEMQSKISALIDDQVKSGSLTSDQGTELKKLFSDVAQKAEAHRQGGPGRTAGAGGPPPPPDGDGDDGTSGTSSSAASLSKSDLAKLFAAFLGRLKQSSATTTAYGTDGSATSSTATSLVLDTQA